VITPTPPTPSTPLTLDATAAAALVGISRSYWMRLVAEERTPEPIRLGRRVLWRRSDIEAWVASGFRCPVAPRARPRSPRQ